MSAKSALYPQEPTSSVRPATSGHCLSANTAAACRTLEQLFDDLIGDGQQVGLRHLCRCSSTHTRLAYSISLPSIRLRDLCVLDVRTCRGQFEQVRTCFVSALHTACNHVQLLVVQFDRLGLVARFPPDDLVFGFLAHDPASMQGHGRNCHVAIFVPYSYPTASNTTINVIAITQPAMQLIGFASCPTARAAWAARADVAYGSNSEILARSRCFPLCPRERTWSDHDGSSVSCHFRNNASQENPRTIRSVRRRWRLGTSTP
jgi:hypothetical protein